MINTRNYWLQIIFAIAFFVLLLIAIRLLSPILAPFAIAAILSYICAPIVDKLVAKKINRLCAVSLVLVVFFAILLALLLLVVPVFYKELSALVLKLPDFFVYINQHLIPLINQKLNLNVSLDVVSIKTWISENLDKTQDMVVKVLANLGVGGKALTVFFSTLFIIPLVAFYMLQQWPSLIGGIKILIPRNMVATVSDLAKKIDLVLGEFLRGQLLVMFILCVFYSFFLWLVGLKFALPVALISGVLAFVPYAGFITGVVLALLMAFLQNEGWGLIIWVLAVFGGGQFLESFILTPYLVGDRIGLHPLLVIFALMAFGQLFGFAGVLLALPISATVVVILRHLKSVYMNSVIYKGHDI